MQAEEQRGFVKALLDILQNEQETSIRQSSMCPHRLQQQMSLHHQLSSTSRTGPAEAGLSTKKIHSKDRYLKMRKPIYETNCCPSLLPRPRKSGYSLSQCFKRSSTMTSPPSGRTSSTAPCNYSILTTQTQFTLVSNVLWPYAVSTDSRAVKQDKISTKS